MERFPVREIGADYRRNARAWQAKTRTRGRRAGNGGAAVVESYAVSNRTGHDFRPSPHREVSQSLQKGENPAKNVENEGMSLSAYLMGGGR